MKKGLCRGFAAFLLLSMLIAAFTACADKGSSDTQTSNSSVSTSAVTDGENILTFPQTADYGGRSFRIMQRTGTKYEFFAEEYNNSILNDAIYSRNLAIEDRYKVDIVTTEYVHTWQDKTFTDNLSVYMTTGEDAFDLIAGYQYYIAPTILNDWYINWQEVPYMDLENPIWDNAVNDVMTINYRTYGITGDLSIAYWKHMSAIVFNKDMAATIGVDLYDVVRNGDWTFEYMKQISEQVASDDGTTAVYGFVSDRSVGIDSFKEAFDIPITKTDNNGKLYFTVATEKVDGIVETLKTFYASPAASHDVDTLREDDPSDKFIAGEALLATQRFEMIERLRKIDLDYGIIPYPKWDSSQEEYRTAVCDGASLFLLPYTAPDTEFVGLITMALAERNYSDVAREYYELVMSSKSARDPESAEMLDLIRESTVTDFGYVYSGCLSGVGHLFRKAVLGGEEGDQGIVTLFANREALANDKLAELYAYYKK
ncbi:MAG: hypothetical protein ACI3XQ_01110 [Eubacteriales bacterium]